MVFKKEKNEYMRPSRKASAISAPLLFAIVVVSVIFVMSIAFRVSDIEVIGNSHYSDQEIINAIEIEQGDNLFFFDRFAAVSRVFAKLPYIEEVAVTRHLPNHVIIEVKESQAVAYIKLGAELWTIDHNCKILGQAAEGEEESLIAILGFKPGTLFIDEELTSEDGKKEPVEYVSAILNQIQDRGLAQSTQKVDMTDLDDVEIYNSNRLIFKIGSNVNTEHKFGMILDALSKLKNGDNGILDVSNGTECKFSPY